METKLFLDVMNPRAEFEMSYRRPAPRVSDLRGKTIALIDNKKTGARLFLDQIKAFLERDFPGIRLINLSKNYNEQHRMKDYMGHLQGIQGAVYATGD